ncbi:hypothetical protein Aduo_014673 [Ancylostoma duodenale]
MYFFVKEFLHGDAVLRENERTRYSVHVLLRCNATIHLTIFGCAVVHGSSGTEFKDENAVVFLYNDFDTEAFHNSVQCCPKAPVFGGSLTRSRIRRGLQLPRPRSSVEQQSSIDRFHNDKVSAKILLLSPTPPPLRY